MSDLISREKLLNEINLLKKSPWYNKDFAAVKLVRKDAVAIVEKCVEEAPGVTEWISVKDRMPEKDTEVLVYRRDLRGLCNCEIDFEYLCADGTWLYCDIYEVLYWMPLPEPPESESDA